MNVVPWRIRSAISDRFPLFYHLASNMFRKREGIEYWDSILAENWNNEGRHWPTKIEIVAQRTPLDASVLDLGCGKGSLLRGLRSLGYQNLSGLEISNYAVERLRNEGFTMFHGALPDIPVANASYDVVVASQVLEHIIRRNKFAAEISRVLRADGQAFFFVPNDCLGPIDEPEHVVKFTKKSLAKLLSRHFDIVSIEVIKDVNFSMSILLAHVINKQQTRYVAQQTA